MRCSKLLCRGTAPKCRVGEAVVVWTIVFLSIGVVGIWCGSSKTVGPSGSNGEHDSQIGNDVIIAPQNHEEKDIYGPEAEVRQCSSNEDCEQKGPCMVAVCQADHTCSYIALEGKPCDDGDKCTENDTCQSDGTCKGTPIKVPQLQCVKCECRPDTGLKCDPLPVGTQCSDGDCCTYGDVCKECDPEEEGCNQYGIACIGQPISCDDGNDCTKDWCECDNSGKHECKHEPVEDGTECVANPNLCTYGDYCLEGQCIPGEPIPLDDGNPCTEDKCVKGEVVHEPILEGPCDDGNECTTDDYCYLGTCVGGPPVECAKMPCSSNAYCVPGVGCVQDWMPAGAACDDGNPCTINDICTEDHQCIGEPINCDDGNPCTKDSCGSDGKCVHEAAPELEGVACLPSDPCYEQGECHNGTCVGTVEVDCDDGNPCTKDYCDPTQGCVHEIDPEQTSLFVDCKQVNEFEDGVCCCFQKDPTNTYFSAQVLDMEQIIPAGTTMECCLTPGYTAGCQATDYIDVSLDGQEWINVLTFHTTTTTNPNGGWKKFCNIVTPEVDFRYVRGGNNNCYVDYFSCEIPCQ